MENVIVTKSKDFAVRIIRAYKYLTQSKPDFYAKLNIALKEASEAEYWLEILYETDYIDKKLYESINSDCEEIIKPLVSITKTQQK